MSVKEVKSNVVTMWTDKQVELHVDQIRKWIHTRNLVGIVQDRELLNSLVEELSQNAGYGAVPEDVWETLGVIDDLVAGRVDRAAELLKSRIPAHLKALKESYETQKSYLEGMEEKITAMVKEAVEVSGRKAVCGLKWKARTQKNSQPVVEVVDESKIPEGYSRRKLSISLDWSASEKGVEDYWMAVKEQWSGFPEFKFDIAATHDRKRMLEEFKPWESSQKEEVPVMTSIPGVRIKRDTHLRLENKVPAGAKIEPIKIPTKEA